MDVRRQENAAGGRWVALALWLGCLAGLTPPAAHGYVLEGYHWVPDEPIVLDLQLGKPDATLLDGSTSWNQVAEAAMDAWNPYLGSGVQFTEHDDTSAPKERDGRNEVFFSKTLYGENFGDDTLATTISFFDTTTKLKSEADVVFNSAVDFDSYRGSLRIDSHGKDAYDFRRVAIHEFGHMLGLEHVSQSAASIMTPATTDIDTIQPDDIAGVRAIYEHLLDPPAITSALAISEPIGGAVDYRIVAQGANITYGAVNLPAGLTLDTKTGSIGGAIHTAGVYQVLITAKNFAGTDTETLTITVATRPLFTSATSAVGQLGQLFLYPITAEFEPTSFSANTPLPPGLTLDASTGLVSGVPKKFGSLNVSLTAANAAGTSSISLAIKILADNAVAVVHVFDSATGEASDNRLVLGTDGNFYGTTLPAAVGGALYRLAPDGTITFVYRFTGGTGAAPSPVIQAADGNFYGLTSRGEATDDGAAFRVTPDGAAATLYSFQTLYGMTHTPALVQGSDGNFYGTVPATAVYGDLSSIIFRLTPDGTLTTLHTFGTDLVYPSALVQAADGNLYGVAEGGTYNAPGAVYRLTPDGTVTILHSFDPTAFYAPQHELAVGRDGNLYGTAFYGGSATGNGGSVFKMALDGTFTTLHTFSAAEGGRPSALLAGQDGNFYGTTTGPGAIDPGNAQGILYRLTPDGTLTVLHTFSADEGVAHTALAQARDGTLYGAQTYNGTGGAGLIYKTTLDAAPIAATAPPVTLAVTKPQVTAGSGGHGQFTVSVPTPQTADLVVYYKLKGAALDGMDFKHLPGVVTIKAGTTSTTIKVKPHGDLRGTGKRTVKLVLTPQPSYTLSGPAVGKVKILAP